MLYMITGAPGAGKTLSAIEFIHKVKAETPDRIIYAANVDGINIPGVIVLDDAGVLAWHEACEKNSLLIVDEAQRYWRAQRSGEPSQAVIEMETHRHDGIDIVMMTQHPTFMHANIRKLTNVHIHLVSYTKTSALRWEWRECHDDVQDTALRASGEFTEWHHNPDWFGDYTSATQHTKRNKTPWKQRLAKAYLWFFGFAIVASLVGFGVYAFRSHALKDLQAPAKLKAPAPSSQTFAGQGASSARPKTTKEYLEAQLPRLPAQPWSAPIYDGQAVTQHPRIFCISMPPPDRCICKTEQGTNYVLEDTICRTVASDGGVYDPYLPERRDQPPPPPSPMQPAFANAATATFIPTPDAGSRSSGVGAQVYTPPTYGKWNPEALSGSSR